MKRKIHYFSSSPNGDESLLDESTDVPPTNNATMIEDIEKLNRQSSAISLRQLEIATSLIRAG